MSLDRFKTGSPLPKRLREYQPNLLHKVYMYKLIIVIGKDMM